jgi:hypothetical protein
MFCCFSLTLCLVQQLLFARQQVPAPVDDLMHQVGVSGAAAEELEGLALRKFKQKAKQLYKQLSPLETVLDTVRSICLNLHGVRRVAFLIGSTVINPQEAYMWEVEQDGPDATPEEGMDDKCAAACARGFMRSLM